MRSHATVPTIALACLSALGCAEDERAEESPTESRVCPSCEPNVGGETGDFGGSPTPCWWMTSPIPVDRTQAEAAGFDVNEIERRLARPIDEPLQWGPLPWAPEPQGGGPASGYQPDTRIRGSVTRGAYVHHRPDPAWCDGTTCRREDTEVAQNSCAQMLEVPIELSLASADGALRAITRGTAVQWKKAPVGGEGGPEDRLIAHAYADLSEVEGSLVLTPDSSLGSHRGELTVVLELYAERIEGTLWPTITWVDRPQLRYEPVAGTFPPAPVGARPAGAAPKDAGPEAP